MTDWLKLLWEQESAEPELTAEGYAVPGLTGAEKGLELEIETSSGEADALEELLTRMGSAHGETVGLPRWVTGETTALAGLYRQAGEALRQAQGAGRMTAGAQELAEPEMAPAGLTLREFDREVRRDSRCYDGGMNIY